MKDTLIYTLITLSLGLAVYSAFQIDWSDLFGEVSRPGILAILLSLISILILIIYKMSAKTQLLIKKKKG